MWRPSPRYSWVSFWENWFIHQAVLWFFSYCLTLFLLNVEITKAILIQIWWSWGIVWKKGWLVAWILKFHSRINEFPVSFFAEWLFLLFADVRRIWWVFHEGFLFLVVEDVVEKYHGEIRLSSEVVLLSNFLTVNIIEPVFQLFTSKFRLIRDPFL